MLLIMSSSSLCYSVTWLSCGQ